jgi:oxygen-independent coproporphyrinogen-3 oxidase
VRRRIANVSLDLIFGAPGQTLDQWRADLAAALALGPTHLSTYGLTYEKGTRLWKERRRGRVAALGEEEELALYCHAMEFLESSGFEQYEISSFARPGWRCRHNQVYWANEAYFGFGMGAARYVGGRREVNTRSLQGYIRRALAGEPATLQSEELPPEERARETLGLQLRRAEGVVRGPFRRQTGFDLDALAGPALRGHAELGLVEDDGASVRLTRRGRCVADALICDLL